MANLRTFLSNYSPMFALGAAIIGLYAMAISIGVALTRTV
jgi:hypothetical protein